MSNERIDDFLSWRERLDDPGALPEHGLDDREAAWERLMRRRREKPRRRWFTGYRIAAACILIALIPAICLFHDRRGNAVVLHHPAAAPQLSVPTQPGAPIAAQPAAKTDAHAAAGTPPLRRLAKPADEKIPKHPCAQLADIEPPTTTVLPASLPETTKPITLTTPPKPERKVININELNGTQPRPHGTADNRNPGFIRLGIGDPNTHGDAQPSDNPPGLKIKLSPQN